MKERVVGLGEIVVTNDADVVLMVPGIGSCIVVCVYHQRTGWAGMAHVVLPSSQGRKDATNKPFWFADIAVPHLIKEFVERGAYRPNCAVVGGANVLPSLAMPSVASQAPIGELNARAVLEHLNGSVNLVAKLIGGQNGMVARLHVADGILVVKDKSGQTRQIHL